VRAPLAVGVVSRPRGARRLAAHSPGRGDPEVSHSAAMEIWSTWPRTAERVSVKLGRSSVHSVEVLSGLGEGDRVILSDMSEWDHDNRIQLE